MTNNITHSWSVKKIFTHDLNSNCVNKIVGQLISDFGEGPIITDHEFYISPNYLAKEYITVTYDEYGNIIPPSIPDTIVWVDQLDGFTPLEDVTESLVWQWIDNHYNRGEIELQVEFVNKPVYKSVSLPWQSS